MKDSSLLVDPAGIYPLLMSYFDHSAHFPQKLASGIQRFTRCSSHRTYHDFAHIVIQT